jgi:hypothetical protein
MSAGYAPDDDDEKMLGPEEESVIDRVNAQPLPAGASAGAMPSEWPPAVPSEAPGMVPRAPPVTGRQAPTLGAPPPPPGAAGPINTSQQTAQAYGDQQDLAAADATAQQNLGAAKTAASTKEADALDEETQRKQDAADETARITQDANKRTQAWADRAQSETEKFQKMELHDYWADKSTGNKILAGLAMLTGAVGRTDNSGNAGMKIVEGAIERDFRMQQAKIAKQKENVGAAREQYQIGLSQKEQALSDNKLMEAAATDASAAKLVALKVRQGIPIEQAQNDADVLALKQKANQLRLGTLKDVHAQNIEDAKLAIEKQKEQDERLKAEAYAKKMSRVGAGGGGGGSLAPISQYIKDHPDDQAGQYAIAEKMGYKGAKAAAIVDKLQNDFKAGPGAKGKVPAVLTDTLTGKDLPIDPTRTDERKHNAAVAGLPQVNGAIQILDEVLKGSEKPHAPEALSMIGFDTSPQADLKGQMTRFRSAYAASKKESVGEANAKELAEAIPDPPSNFSSTASFNNWKKKIESTRKELHDSRAGLLANAGVPPDALKGAGAGAKPPGETPPARPPAKLDNRDLALKVKAQATIKDPNADPALKASAQAYLTRIGG